MNTRETTTTKKHYMGTPFAQNTACGRYVAQWDTKTVWTPEPSQVTCRRCLNNMRA